MNLSWVPAASGRRLGVLAIVGAAAAVLPACAQEVGEPIGSQMAEIGEPVGALPSHNERVLGFWTNRIRTDPAPFDALLSSTGAPSGRPIPAATRPLEIVADLARAAHFQSNHIATTACPLCSDHSSCCQLTGKDDTVQCAGPVTTCGVTSRNARFALFSTRASGENGEEGSYSSEMAMFLWISSNIHWETINSGGFSALGTGAAESSNKRTHHLVFGSGGTYPVAADGTHFFELSRSGFQVKQAPANNPTFGITYYLPGGGAPKTAELVRSVDSATPTCEALALAHGKAEHGTYEKVLTLPSGCHRYFFRVVDGKGVERLFPTTGTLGVFVGTKSDNCPDFSPVRTAAPCAGTPAGTSDGGTIDASGNDASVSDAKGSDASASDAKAGDGSGSGSDAKAGDASGSDASGSDASSSDASSSEASASDASGSDAKAGDGAGTDSGDGNGVAGADSSDGCGCHLAASRSRGSAIALLVLAGLVLRRRNRQRLHS